MIKGKCCICGTVKNCGPFLEKIFKNIEAIGNIFEDYRIWNKEEYDIEITL